MSDILAKIETYVDQKKHSEEIVDEILAFAGSCSLDTHPTKHNWVEDHGGLPQYICEIAKDLVENGHPIERAISIAVSRVKVWAAGGGNVKPDTQAKAAKAAAQWEALKAKAHASKGGK